MRRMLWLFPLLLVGSVLLGAAARKATAPAHHAHKLKLWNTVTLKARAKGAAPALEVRVEPGDKTEADVYYEAIRKNLATFPRRTLPESSISDMLAYFGFPALPPEELERLNPSVIMSFTELRKAINTPEFEAAYRDHPLVGGEIVVARFFAPKIINVGDPQAGGVPKGGFGWRKVLRFRARQGASARRDGLDQLYLLFNFADDRPIFPEGKHAGQIQGLLVPTYPKGQHRDAYFLVYVGLGEAANPGKIGFFLTANFDLASAVPADGKYYVPTACGQCHGTEESDQAGAKVNYLDTDHWIDRTGDDFRKISPDSVLVDGARSFAAIRALNVDIERQNSAVIPRSGGTTFARLAVRKWLQLHPGTRPGAHVPPLQRGFFENTGDRVWASGASPDEELLPLLNQYCFRCHSSVRFHVFEKQAVFDRKEEIAARVGGGNMPQDRTLDKNLRDKIIGLVNNLK